MRKNKKHNGIINAADKPPIIWYDKVKDELLIEPVFDLAIELKLPFDRKRFVRIGSL